MHANAYGFLRYVGMDVMKPDVNVRRMLYRLGLIVSPNINKETLKQIQTIGEKMAKANKVKVVEVDCTLNMYGAGEKPFAKYAVCSETPKCEICELERYCGKAEIIRSYDITYDAP